jgi:2-keto-4-pentenoate hydratase/2-oxohepta-3-ene-1,7-dioic acid hydratase in catechol pathway
MKSISLPIYGKDTSYQLKPEKIIALGGNYREHIAESASVGVKSFTDLIPKEPLLFPKTINCLIEAGENIVIPKFIEKYKFENPRVDHEAELAFIIKKQCKNISESEAMDYILGFTCLNDVSQRNIQKGDRSGWFRGKSFDTFGPIGPQLVLTEDIGDPQNLKIVCRLNGEVKQESNTNKMIFNIPEIVSFISKNFTLEEGDIITTGTPAGVSPLKHGDIVEIEIEKIGVLKNPVVEESKL